MSYQIVLCDKQLVFSSQVDEDWLAIFISLLCIVRFRMSFGYVHFTFTGFIFLRTNLHLGEVVIS